MINRRIVVIGIVSRFTKGTMAVTAKIKLKVAGNIMLPASLRRSPLSRYSATRRRNRM